MPRKILLTGGAGFIGYHIAKKLLENGDNVIIADNFNAYYDVKLKENRTKYLYEIFKNVKIYNIDISNYARLKIIFDLHKFDKVCHLAAQAGVRYSMDNPFAYEQANNLGTLNLLELCRNFDVPHFVYASSSSVYGKNEKMPFAESDNVDQPISIYAATKKYNELLAHSYHHLFKIKTTGLRFFTVYGPWGRPDMALFKFTKNILEGKPIDVYNYGEMKRDFTYISDIVNGIFSALNNEFTCEVFNLARGESRNLREYIAAIEINLGKKAILNYLPLQPGDIPETNADISKAAKFLDYHPKVSIEEGINNFVNWYKDYYS